MSKQVQVDQWDFDDWMNLARNDPEKFEALRSEAIERLISSVPEERKIHLRRLQWRIDRVRERAKTPMAATMAISHMMWERFNDLRCQYREVLGKDKTRQRPAQAPATAKILRFEPRERV